MNSVNIIKIVPFYKVADVFHKCTLCADDDEDDE